MAAHPADIVDFWRAAGPGRWFKKDDALRRGDPAEVRADASRRGPRRVRPLDRERRRRAGAAAPARPVPAQPLPRLGPRLRHRPPGPPASRARRSTRGHDRRFEPALRSFFYLPFDALRGPGRPGPRRCALFEAHEGADRRRGEPEVGDRATATSSARFGRFPHRNRALGRTTTPEEQAFLDEGGFAG